MITELTIKKYGLTFRNIARATLLVGDGNSAKEDALEDAANRASETGAPVATASYTNGGKAKSTLLRAIDDATNGVLVGDHALDGLHHTELESTIEDMLDKAAKQNTQIVLSTERRDCVEAFACAAATRPGLQLVRLEGPDNTTGKARSVLYRKDALVYLGQNFIECR